MDTQEAFLQPRIFTKCLDRGRQLFVAFVDCSKAFDKVNWKTMFKTMVEYQIPHENFHNIWELYRNQTARIEIQNEESEPVLIQKGVRKGCVMSPILFNMCKDKMMRK